MSASDPGGRRSAGRQPRRRHAAELDGRRAPHFPQDEDGGWAGHHPADSEEAIGQLEELRGGGAGYLVVPPTYRWWLSHYDGLREHLDDRYQRVLCDEQAGAIYRLEEVAMSRDIDRRACPQPGGV